MTRNGKVVLIPDMSMLRVGQMLPVLVTSLGGRKVFSISNNQSKYMITLLKQDKNHCSLPYHCYRHCWYTCMLPPTHYVSVFNLWHDTYI